MASMYVRVVTPGHNFAKEVEVNGKLVSIQVHGFDELGRPVMPVHEVPQCEEVVSAIFREPIFDVDKDGKRIPRFSGRLVQIEGDLANTLPKWIGHPMRGDSLDAILLKTKRIREEQRKGDNILGLAEPSEPYTPPIDVMPGFDANEADLEKRREHISKFEKALSSIHDPNSDQVAA